MSSFQNNFVLGACALGVGALGLASVSSMPANAANFKGKRITLYVAASPGGGYAAYARTVAKFWGANIPGNPRFLVKHKQGASGVVALNYLYFVAKKDGTEVLASYREAASTTPLLSTPEERKNFRYDLTKMGWIGSVNSYYGVCVAWHTSGVKNFDDVKTKGLKMGGTHFGNLSTQAPRVMNNLLDTKIEVYSGYPAGTNVNLAMERGEVDGRCWSVDSIKSIAPQWWDQKKIIPFIQLGIQSYPGLEHVPVIIDLAKTKKDRQILNLLFSNSGMARPYVGPPGMTKDILQTLRTSFIKTTKDKGFLAGAKKVRLDIDVVSGEQIEKIIKNIYATPESVVQEALAVINSTAKTKTVKVKIPVVTETVKITKVRREGRRISFKGKSGKVTVSASGRRTKVKIAGKKAKRSAVKAGMTCTIAHQGHRSTAKSISCK